jgi:hypothetical protein
MKNWVKDWLKTMGKVCLFLTGWIPLIHEGSHYITCLTLGNTPIYHITSVTCDVVGFNAFIVAIAPYLVGLVVMLFIAKIWVRLAIACDIVGNFMGSVIGNSFNDFTAILHTNIAFYVVGVAIAIMALVIAGKEVGVYAQKY